MLELLIAWGGSEAVKFIAGEVIGELAKGTAEDYVKDFFKQGLSDAIGGIKNGKPLQKATAQAIKDFLDLGKQELENAELSESELKEYSKFFKQFIKNPSVLEVLVSAFDNNLKLLDTNKLATTWNEINSPLPDDFDWEFLAKQYRRNVKNIIRQSDELRAILDSENLEKSANKNSEIRPEFDLKKHQEGIREQYGNLKLESLDTSGYGYNELKLWRMFIPQNVRESQEFMPQVHEIPKEYLKQLKDSGQLESDFSPEQLEGRRRRYFEQQTRSVLELIEDNNYKYLVILGDPGSGKSTLLQYIALQWAELPRKDLSLKPIPLLIELRTYVRNHNANQCKDFLEFLEKGSGVTCRLPQQELHTKFQNGDAIVMFDGLDEVFEPAKREEIITDIHRFTNDYKNVRVIVTSRVIGYKPQKLRDAEFYHFMLQDLEDEQVEDFMQRWHNLTYQDEAERERKRERLKRAIKDSSAIKELAGNPLLLTMMAVLNRHQELPKDRAELYNQASRILLQQWDMERTLVDANLNPNTIDYKDKQEILRQVASFMQRNKEGLAGNLISEKDLEKIIRDYLKSVDINDARNMARVLMEQLRSRNFILCFVGAEYYAFVHRTFLEYFCAWSFVWDFKETQSLGRDDLINDVFGNHWRDAKWHEVLGLIAGMIDAKFVGEIISYLMEQEGEEENFVNLFLAGKCLFEVRSRQSIGDVGNRLLNRLKDLTGYDLGYYYRPYDDEGKLVREIRTKAVEVLATTWRDDNSTYIWLKQRVVSDDTSSVRIEAVRQIATGWKNEEGILELLKQWVVSDESSDVRRAAVRQIATGWKNEEGILELLKQWV
ncbi:NACHT domain-containing protein, partial [Dapis sp. BLCC M229]|uniref:NACHT domain-containing protein n=1 Tax=Dapis sp. BLCC M229 TaxID=3400188 RepID=UPI003CF4A9E8